MDALFSLCFKQTFGFNCSGCDKLSPDLKFCSRCKKVKYCSVICQRKDFGRHQDKCVPFKEEPKDQQGQSKSTSGSLQELEEARSQFLLMIDHYVRFPISNSKIGLGEFFKHAETSRVRGDQLRAWAKNVQRLEDFPEFFIKYWNEKGKHFPKISEYVEESTDQENVPKTSATATNVEKCIGQNKVPMTPTASTNVGKCTCQNNVSKSSAGSANYEKPIGQNGLPKSSSGSANAEKSIGQNGLPKSSADSANVEKSIGQNGLPKSSSGSANAEKSIGQKGLQKSEKMESSDRKNGRGSERGKVKKTNPKSSKKVNKSPNSNLASEPKSSQSKSETYSQVESTSSDEQPCLRLRLLKILDDALEEAESDFMSGDPQYSYGLGFLAPKDNLK